MKAHVLGFVILLAIATATPVVASNGETLLDVAKEASWTVGNEHALESLIATNEEVRALISAVFGDELAISEVADFRFTDLNGDGALELIASVDVSGRRFFNTIIVLWKRNKWINVEEIPAFNVMHLGDVLKDLNGDGQKEIVVLDMSGEYRGVESVPTTLKVYRIQGAGYIEASRDFKPYYRDVVIPMLQERLEIAKRAKHTGLVGQLQRELSEAQRVLNE